MLGDEVKLGIEPVQWLRFPEAERRLGVDVNTTDGPIWMRPDFRGVVDDEADTEPRYIPPLVTEEAVKVAVKWDGLFRGEILLTPEEHAAICAEVEPEMASFRFVDQLK